MNKIRFILQNVLDDATLSSVAATSVVQLNMLTRVVTLPTIDGGTGFSFHTNVGNLVTYGYTNCHEFPLSVVRNKSLLLLTP